MLIARSLLFAVGQVVSALVFSVVAILSFPLPPVTRSRIISGWARSMIWWLRVTCRLTYRVDGIEHVPPSPCVILSKHQSAWETLAFQVIFPPQAWVLKRELLWIPFFGWGLAASRPIAIDRNAGVRAIERVVQQGIDRLRGGRYVVVFPEGTRVDPGERGRYNPGGAMLALKAQVPIIPVAHNAGEFWPRHGFVKRPGTIRVIVGPRIGVAGKRARQLSREAETWIEDTMQVIRASAAGGHG